MRTQLRVMRAWLATLLNAERRDDRGEIVQNVIMIALFVAATIIIVGILVSKAMSAANSVRTQ